MVMKEVWLHYEDHPACPNCGSLNTAKEVKGEHNDPCLCGGGCWTNPYCYDCGFAGYSNSAGNIWKRWDNVKE